MSELKLLPENRFSLSFAYDENVVAQIKSLSGRRWNSEERYWELPITHLGTVMRLFQIDNSTLDKKLLRAWQMHQIRAARVKAQPGNVETTLVGVGLPVDKIDEVTSFFVPGYRYMPRYKKGQWDGKKHLFNAKNQTLPTGLLDRVRQVLEGQGVICEVEDAPLPEPQPVFDPSVPAAAPGKKASEKPAKGKGKAKAAAPIELRDYQADCIQAAVAGRRGVLQLATGGGKTLIAAHIIRELNRPALFLVHTRDLLHQTRRVFADFLQVPIGQAGDGVVDIQPITVATVQTCARALDVKVVKTPDDDEVLENDRTELSGSTAGDLARYIRKVPVVFFDECHHLPADTTYDLAMEMAGAAWRYGLSATPFRADRLDLLLEAALGPKLYSAPASVLIEKGFLVPPQIQFVPVPPLVVVSGRPEYQEIYSSYVVENPRRNELIVRSVGQLRTKGKSVLILVSQVKHGEILQGMMPGVPLVQGTDPADKRAEVFAGLQAKEMPVVIATTLADEGLDVPTLDAVILASAGRSETRALQRVGRALRPAPKKKEAVVVDFLDQAPFLNDHAKRRLEIFRSEPAFKVSMKTNETRAAAAAAK